VDIVERCWKYIQKMQPSVSGANGHDAIFSVACKIVRDFAIPDGQALSLLQRWNAINSQPPWTDKELERKLREAQKKADAEPMKIGALADTSGGTPYEKRCGLSSITFAKGKAVACQTYVESDVDVPVECTDEKISDTEKFLTALFKPRELVCICTSTINDKGREVPSHDMIKSLEDWIEIERAEGIDKTFSRTHQGGIYFSVNPCATDKGRADNNVASFRNMLIEFDDGTEAQQLAQIELIKQDIPVYTVATSGGKSVHAVVEAHVNTEEEFRALFAKRLAKYVFMCKKTGNSSRLSRLAGCTRNGTIQRLISVLTRAPEPLPQRVVGRMTTDDLFSVNFQDTSRTLYGKNRWLCQGGTALISGPTGGGKSTLTMQMMVLAAIGADWFGIPGPNPSRPLKSMLVQAENDSMDLAEMLRGACSSLDIPPRKITGQIVTYHDATHTGQAFCDAMKARIALEKPDIVWIDPFMSYLGGDVSDQAAVSVFLRNGLQPIINETQVCVILIHHDGKPEKQTTVGGKTKVNAAYHAYSSLGSSDISNWARAIMRLEPKGEGNFVLHFAKRGGRTGLGKYEINMRHARGVQAWEVAPDDPTVTIAGTPEPADTQKCWGDEFVSIAKVAFKEGIKTRIDLLPWMVNKVPGICGIARFSDSMFGVRWKNFGRECPQSKL